MRFCGSFVRLQNFARTENRPQAHRVARQGVGSAFLAVDDADRRSHRQTALAERREDVWARLEAVLVEVVAGPLPRAQDEVAFEVCGLAQRGFQLCFSQEERASPMIRRASGSSRSAPGEPSVSESIEPSSK